MPAGASCDDSQALPTPNARGWSLAAATKNEIVAYLRRCPYARSQRCRLNVLVVAEEVRRVALVLQSDGPGGIPSVGGPDAARPRLAVLGATIDGRAGLSARRRH